MLEVQARDYGSPLLSTSVLVNIVIEDANDNPPLFPEGNYTVFVQEDKPYGHILLTFSVTDADDAPNGVPFSWSVISDIFLMFYSLILQHRETWHLSGLKGGGDSGFEPGTVELSFMVCRHRKLVLC